MRIREAALISIVVITLGACSKPDTSEMAAHDAAVAAANADATAAQVPAREQQQADDAQQRAGATTDDVSHRSAADNQATADARIKGDLDAALAKCESLSGSAKSACTNRAHAQHDSRSTNVSPERTTSDPQP